MDWIVDLLESNGYTHIWVIVDRFTIMAHLIPLPTKVLAKDIANIFLTEIQKHMAYERTLYQTETLK